MATAVFTFEEGSRDQRGLLGGKGANLAEMTRRGLLVPPGFTITTAACLAAEGVLPGAIAWHTRTWRSC